jgi:hypothetical protein
VLSTCSGVCDAQSKALAVRRRQMKHVLFTDPATLEAGTTVELYFNPRDTVLSGRRSIWLRGGFNRWRHPRPFGPIEMVPPEDGEHFRVRTDGWTDRLGTCVACPLKVDARMDRLSDRETVR